MAAFDPRAFLEQPGEGKTLLVFKAGTVIFKQGAPAEQVFFLQRGIAKEQVTSGTGKEAVTGMLEPGSFFGTGVIDGGMLRTSTVTAITTCNLTAMTRETIVKALDQPGFAQMFVEYLLSRTNKIEAERVNLLFHSVEKRLAKKLLELSHTGSDAPQPIGPEVSQEMLAEMIGTQRTRVNFFLNKFRRLGYIKYNGAITVLPALVRVLAREKADE